MRTSKYKLSLSVQYPDERLKDVLTRSRLRRWVAKTLLMDTTLTIRIVNRFEGRRLNRDYRNKDYATNVLTFTYLEQETLSKSKKKTAVADIILCTDVLKKEAKEQKKDLLAHAAHLVIHGALHAQGFTHENDKNAHKMESLEVKILNQLGIANPYQ